MATLKGFHHLIMPDGRQEHMVVVEFDGQGHYLSHHPLRGEEAFVEWVGGTLEIES